MSGFIAVHCGAGYHKSSLHLSYKKLCKKACEEAAKILDAGGTCLQACQRAVMVLEDNALTNSGFGSNLTLSGSVECDASIMDGESLNFGACGAVKGVKNPISLASRICLDQLIEHPLGLIPPSLLVGPGATKYAKLSNITLIENKKMVSIKAYKRYIRDKSNEQLNDHIKRRKVEERLDTVGAVCVDSRGHLAAACSSGGLLLKHSGRVGQGATYASGVWADSINNKTDKSIAVTTTGTGEYLVKTLLAKEIANSMKNNMCPVTGFHKALKDEFLESKYLPNIPQKIGGALALYVTPSGHGELIWGHSSRSMVFAYMDMSKKKPRSMVSELPRSMEGNNCVVSGVSFKLNVQ